MTAPKAYTPLEKLMLVQELDSLDLNPPSFEKISESLKTNALLRESVSYDPNRLNPEPLKQLYLRLMKEEAKLEVEGAESARDGRDGGRNRHRIMSPLLETVSEASRHTKLIPSLLDRVYFLYRNNAIREIESEESKYKSLQRDIKEIIQGEWDARFQLEATRRDAKEGLKPIHTVLRHEPDGGKTRAENVPQPAKSPPLNGESATTPPNQEPKGLVDLSIRKVVKPVQPPNVEVPKEKPIVLETVQQPTGEEPKDLPNVEVTSPPQAPPKKELQQLPETESTVTGPPIALAEKVIPSATPRPAQSSGITSNSPDVSQPVQRQPVQHPPDSPVVSQPTQHPPDSPDAKQPAQHPPASSDVNQPVEHPPAASGINQPVQHPPAPSDVNQPAPHPPDSSDINQPVQHPLASSDVNQPVQHPPDSSDFIQPVQHLPNSSDVNQPEQYPPASSDANQPAQHPPDSPDAKQPAQHPPASLDVNQPVEHPPASSGANQPVQHPPASSDVNRKFTNPTPFLDSKERSSYQPPSPDVNKRNTQPLPSPDTTQRIPHHPTSPAANQRDSFSPPQPMADVPSSASPHPQILSVPSPDQPPQSPITLPPLAGVLRSTVSPLVPLETLADMAGQQPYKPNNSIRGGRPAAVQPHSIQLPTPRNYPVPLYPYYDTQQSYGAPYSPYGHSPMPSYHHVNPHSMQPYQGTASSPGRGPVYGTVPYYPNETPSYSQYPAYSQSSSFTQTPVQNQFNRNAAPRFHDIHTPLPGGSGRSRPPRPSPINTSTTSTRWKNVEVPGSVRSPISPRRPGPGEISPLSERSASPFSETLPETVPHQIMQVDSPTSTKGRGRRGRGRARGRGKVGSVRGRSRVGRAGSTISTVPDSAQARTRSPSILSHAEDALTDSKTSTKPELVATPTGDEDSPATETTADEELRQSVRQSTRPRRATLCSLDNADPDPANKKRKLSPSESLISSPSPSSNSNISRHNFILGSRNFARTSATIMNDISAHKLASLFAKPLTDRDAPGYKNLIYRPQDLKSLKSAIGAGGRALAAAADGSGAADAGSPVTQLGSMTPLNNARSSTVWIPATSDVVPPKGIVNSAQLEKELMRMFANAVMFNPDPKRGFGPAFRERSGRHHHHIQLGENGLADKNREEEEHTVTPADDEEEGGVVKDAREMYAAVERSVTNWRGAERAVENSAAAAAAGPLGSGGLLGSAVKGSMARRRGGADESAEASETSGGVGANEEGPDEDITGGKRRRR